MRILKRGFNTYATDGGDSSGIEMIALGGDVALKRNHINNILVNRVIGTLERLGNEELRKAPSKPVTFKLLVKGIHTNRIINMIYRKY